VEVDHSGPNWNRHLAVATTATANAKQEKRLNRHIQDHFVARFRKRQTIGPLAERETWLV